MIEKSEFREVMGHGGLYLSSHEIELLISKFYANGLEYLNYEEFMGLIHGKLFVVCLARPFHRGSVFAFLTRALATPILSLHCICCSFALLTTLQPNLQSMPTRSSARNYAQSKSGVCVWVLPTPFGFHA